MKLPQDADWLGDLRHALDARAERVQVFFRDDDAGWADDRLFALMDVFERHAVPLDLAVIPAALTPACAAALRLRTRMATGLFHLHQHGYTHENHEPAGRKCEFGPARSRMQQAQDIAAGQLRLRELCGDEVTPIFTPPWNRCTAETCETLAAQGFRAVSTDQSARLDSSLPNLRVALDWSREWREGGGDPSHLGRALQKRLMAGGTVGIMLHHADFDADSHLVLAACLSLLGAHPKVQATPMHTHLY